jgi:hypothetical protein
MLKKIVGHDGCHRLEKKIAATRQKVEKMRLDMRIKDDLKTVALGTSKINYMDPRITVAWCKLHEVPIEKVVFILVYSCVFCLRMISFYYCGIVG